MFFLISIAFGTPSDLPSGECANEVASTTQDSGKELYTNHCAGCHQADGSGEDNYFPPVVGTPWVESPTALTNVLLRGVSGTIHVNEKRYASYMSPYGKEMSDKELLLLINYVRHELNNYPSTTDWTIETISQIRTDIEEQGNQTIRGQSGLDALLTEDMTSPKTISPKTISD